MNRSRDCPSAVFFNFRNTLRYQCSIYRELAVLDSSFSINLVHRESVSSADETVVLTDYDYFYCNLNVTN